ncbi:MAG: response regulator [Planctomycetaceae bacterium]|jgi:signal transduction histidine kinase|nr:response regulator [Planctomycetaceae bacterium]
MTAFSLSTLHLIIIAALVFKGILTVALWNRRVTRYQGITWLILLLILAADVASTNYSVQSAKNFIRINLTAITRVFAVSAAELDYEQITPAMNNADPLYLRLLNMMAVWQDTCRNYAASVYIVRENAQGQAVFVLCPAADLNRDGKIEGWREYQVANSTVYEDGALTEIWAALQGKGGCAMQPFKDKWGYWIAAAEPIYSKEGQIVGAFVVDYWGEDWDYRIFLADLFTQLFFLPCLVLFFTVDILLIRRHTIASRLMGYTLDLERTMDELVLERHSSQAAIQAKKYFLSNMQSEIRTPLNAVLDCAEMLAAKVSGANNSGLSTEQLIEDIRKSSKELGIVLDDFLMFSKINAKRLVLESVPVNVRLLIENVFENTAARFAEKPLIRHSLDYGSDVPQMILSDPTQLRQMISDLVDNAVKFTERGSITIRVSLLRPDPKYLSQNGVMRSGYQKTFRMLMRSAGAARTIDMLFTPPQTISGLVESPSGLPVLCIMVSDTGVGLSAEQIEQIFQPVDVFSPQRDGGMSGGLGVVRGLAQLMGGNVLVDSEPGKGSAFSICIPCVRPEEAVSLSGMPSHLRKPVQLNTNPLLPLHKRRILVADNVVVNQLIAEERLQAAGATVETASNGQTAVERVMAAEKSSFAYDAVLMDVSMPVMDGITAAKELRAQGFSKPVIAVVDKTLISGGVHFSCCNAVLEKPFDTGTLVNTVLTCLRG